LSPYLTAGETLPLLNKATRYGGLVTERVLGFGREVKSGQQNPLKKEHPDYWGYRHSSAPVAVLLNATPMVQIDCKNVDNCKHATFLSVVDWLKQHPSTKALPKKQLITARIQVIDTGTRKPIPFAYVHIYKKNAFRKGKLWNNIDPLIKLVQTNQQGIATTRIEFEPKAAYYLDVKAWGYHSFRDFKVIRMGKTRLATSSYWGKVRLIPKQDRKRIASLGG
jgi:hypothetical protein